MSPAKANNTSTINAIIESDDQNMSTKQSAAALDSSHSKKNVADNSNNYKSDEMTKKIHDEKQAIEHQAESILVHHQAARVTCPLEKELLGSVTTMSSVRSSARVIQKMKMDLIRPVSPPIVEKKDTSSSNTSQKTPNQTKPIKMMWTNIERNLFFEALNEFGKDFDAISHYINTKQKRKSNTDPTYKTKDHVRLLYYQNFHKVTKYLRFSDDIKKHAQELYGLINYGEMRKKLLFVNQKACMKLKELVYKGSVTIRVKGKNIRIKTPSCKALRKLNQLEEWQEEIKLPSKIDVFLKPATIESWGRVQSLAQNPRVKTILPLQKRVVSLLKTFQQRWRSRDTRLCEQSLALVANSDHKNHQQNKHNVDTKVNQTNCQSDQENVQFVANAEPILRLAPPSDTVIHRPMVNLAEFLSSYSICLNSYEDRIGVGVKGETLSTERLNTLKELLRTNSKRQRHDSGSEKKSPEFKRSKSDSIDVKSNVEIKSDETNTAEGIEHFIGEYAMNTSSFEIDGITHISDGISSTDENEHKEKDISFENENNSKVLNAVDNNEVSSSTCLLPPIIEEFASVETEQKNVSVISSDIIASPLQSRTAAEVVKKEKKNISKCQTNKKNSNKRESFRPILNEEIIKEIKKGWTLVDVGDLTVGDLYIMFGQDYKVNLEYSWVTYKRSEEETLQQTTTATTPNETADASSTIDLKKDNNVTVTTPTNKMESKPQIYTAVSCEKGLSNKLKQLLQLANMHEKAKKKNGCSCGHSCDRNFKIKKDEVFPRSFISNKIYPSSHTDQGIFRQPVLPLRSGLSPVEAYKLNLYNSRNKQSKWLKNRNNRPSKQQQVVVQRLLPLQPGITHCVVPSINCVPAAPKSKIDLLTLSKRTNDISKILEIDSSCDSFDSSEQIKSKKKVECLDGSQKSQSTSQKNKIDLNQPNESSRTANEKSPKEDNIEIEEEEEEDEYEDPGIRSLMEISLPSPAISMSNMDDCFSFNSNPPMSPMTMLRQSPTDPKWFDENVNDYSFSSFLGHLETAYEGDKRTRNSPRRDSDSSRLSTISETSVDYLKQFEELAQSMICQDQQIDNAK